MTNKRRPTSRTSSDALAPEVDAFLKRAKAWIASRSVVVFACPSIDEPNPRMEQVGSGLLFEEHGDTFFVTAAHVGDWWTIHRCNLAVKSWTGSGKPVPIVGTKMISTPTPPQCRADDRVDVAVLYVPPAAAAELRATCRPLSLDEMDLSYAPDANDRVALCGFPVAEPWSVQRDDGHIAYEVAFFPTALRRDVPPKLARTFGYGALYPQYSKKRMVNTNAARGVPEPEGVSGGGVWLIHRGWPLRSSWTEEHIRLLGIVHTKRLEHECLVATRVTEAVQYGRDLLQHVRRLGS